jgi:hypothetical protein
MVDMDDKEYCELCECEMAEGEEHNPIAHGSSFERAQELAEWKQSFKQ